MVFKKFVEVGRVCQINYGPEQGKICTIVNVVDMNRVLVDGPFPITGVKRQVINIKRLTLTSIKVNISLQAREKQIKKAFEAEDVMNKWKESGLYKKMDKQAKRADMNDFDRFKLAIARKTRARAIRKKLKELRK